METALYIDALMQTGLTKDEALVYTTLIMRNNSTASALAVRSSLSRPLTYKILDGLIEKELVTKVDLPKAVSRFTAEHPLKLRELIDSQRIKLEQNKSALEGALGPLISAYTALSGKPGVRILEGVAGIEELYEDILNENQALLLIRSPKDVSHPELQDIVTAQIDAQVKQNIHTQAITPFTNETSEELENWDGAHLVTRRLVHLDTLRIPAQILIYANKVALTAYEEKLMTTIIDNEAIAMTFRLLFSVLWDTSEKSDSEIRTGLKAGTLTAPLL